MLETECEIVGGHDMSEISGGVGTYNAHRRREDDEEGHDGDHPHDLRQDEVAGRVDTHDFQGIDLLGDAHRADLGSDIRAHLTSQNETHDGTGELEEHNLAGGIATHPTGHPRTLDVKLHLDADDRTDEE